METPSNPNNRNCGKCSRTDSMNNMVGCDVCEVWLHFDCAGVNDSIADPSRSYKCDRCNAEDIALETNSQITKTSRRSSTSSKKSQHLKQSLQLLEERRQCRLKQAAQEEEYFQSKLKLLEQIAEEEDMASNKSRVSVATKTANVQQWLDAGGMTEGAGEPSATTSPKGNSPQKCSNNLVATNQDAFVTAEKSGIAPKSLGLTAGNVQMHSSRPFVSDDTHGGAVIPRLDNAPELLITSKLKAANLELAVPTRSEVFATDFGDGQTGANIPSPFSHYFLPSKGLSGYFGSSPIVQRTRGYTSNRLTLVQHNLPNPFAPIMSSTSRTLPPTREVEKQFLSANIDPPQVAVPVSIAANPSIAPPVVPPQLQRNVPLTFTGQSHESRWNDDTHSPTVLPVMSPHLQRRASMTSTGKQSLPYGSEYKDDYVGTAAHLPVAPPVEQPRTQGNMHIPPTSRLTLPHGSGYNEVFVGPNAAQLAARQVMPRDLPTFYGNPQDWPIFYSSFKNTSQACGYSDTENLSRLQRCLQGQALEAVRSRLLLPASVPGVLETLRRLYGRPEILIATLLTKVRAVPPPSATDLNSIITFGLAVQNLVDHVIISEQQDHLANPMLLSELVDRLPPHIKMEWAGFKRMQMNVNLATFNEFMTGLVEKASEVTLPSTTAPFTQSKQAKGERNKYQEKLFTHVSKDETEPISKRGESNLKPCSFCESVYHQISKCNDFRALDLDSRWKVVRQMGLCRICLVKHRNWPCRSKQICEFEGCRFRHNTLLHDSSHQQENASSTSPNNRPQAGDSVNQNFHFAKSYSLFRYLPVTLSGNGKEINTYAFLDDGSSSTLLEAEMAALLGVTGTPESLWLCWTGKITRQGKASERICITITGTGMKDKFTLENVRTVDKLDLPNQTLNYTELSTAYPHLKGLPVQNYFDVAPRLIIGIEHARLLTTLKVREGAACDPIAAKTRLGWCIYGRNSGQGKTVEHIFAHACDDIDNNELHDLMKQFFALDEPLIEKKMQSNSNIRALEILEKTTVRTLTGYETGLLWKVDKPEFPNSFPMAVKRLHCLEKRLARDPVLKTKVKEQICDYEKKGYAHRATKEELAESDPRRIWFLPLGVVTNPRKPNKIRLIWDAAAKVNGICFNDLLLKGPDMTTSLPAILLRFRQRNVAITGDIRKMFHQVKIREQDKQSQRFLWRDKPTDPFQILVMDVATFGATCSPCSVQYVKNKNASDFVETHPRAAEAVIEDHYVDDLLYSVDTVDEAVQLVNDVKLIHSTAGFEIRNFLSNSVEVLQRLGETEHRPHKLLNLDNPEPERVLGMIWIPLEDVFSFETISRPEIQKLLESKQIPTKRQVLRTVMSIFDPLGFVAHYVIHGKVLMQEIWRSGVDWDEELDDRLFARWLQWSNLINCLSEVRIPRCFFYGTPKTLENVDLHIFVDASEVAYSCVAYLRIVDQDGPRCVLVCAKTKVAPLKPLSIPRLELMAAVLGVRVMDQICTSLSITINQRFLWSDSATVLAWIPSDSRRYHQFVAVRIGEILTLSKVSEWRHVPSKSNVADEATKWGSGPTFMSDNRWYNGPLFLYDHENLWPAQSNSLSTTDEELRPVFMHRGNAANPMIDVGRFSNWNRLLRAMAYVVRSCELFRGNSNMEGKCISREDLHRAENVMWRQIQMDAFPDDLTVLKKSSGRGKLDRSSKLYKLSPFLDEAGVIRMGSRICEALCVPYAAKYPVILPKKHQATLLLIDSYHRMFLHGNGETVHNEIRQKFYIPSLRTLIRRVAKDCQYCKIKKATPKPPIMAPLPRIRLTPFIRPFTYVGVDYFGPVMVKVGRSVVKRWVALFTCLTVRAVHMEVVHSLSTQSCIMAFRRFVSRRGAPTEVYSDNGTNFVGADRVLAAEIKAINEECAYTFTNARTSWHFNPPAAPHMGGAWERMVRSVKTAMKAIEECSHYPNDETLETIVLEAEGIVNSRPLTYIPLDSADQEALTPNHFLLYGTQGITQASCKLEDSPRNLRDSWKLARHLVDSFWRRWVREYLPMLTRRTKWFDPVKPLETGDLVVVIDGNYRNQWQRGRILDVVKGRDGQVRRARVQTTQGVLSLMD